MIAFNTSNQQERFKNASFQFLLRKYKKIFTISDLLFNWLLPSREYRQSTVDSLAKFTALVHTAFLVSLVNHVLLVGGLSTFPSG